MLSLFRDFFFPHRLQRLSHIIRFWLCFALILWLSLQRPVTPLQGLGVVLGLLYLILFCIAPRARDSGLPVWTSWLFLVPAVNIILVYALFLAGQSGPILSWVNREATFFSSLGFALCAVG